MRIPVLRSLLIAALTLSGVTGATISTTTPVTADCGSQPAPPDRVGVGYRGTVTGVDEISSGLFAVTLAVDRTLAGPARGTVTFKTGDYADCHMIDGSAIHEGDELVVVGTDWWKPRKLAYPFAWRARDGDRWDLSVIARENRRRLPADVRAVNTYPEILAFIGAGLPPTDTEPSPLPSPMLSARGEAEDDLFQLTIETPDTTFVVGEPIAISTTLTSIGTAPTTTVTHAGGNIVAFGIEQLDGPLDAGPLRRMSCTAQVVSSGDVASVPFSKSGGYAQDDPLAPMWSAWLHDPAVRPPVGIFRIDAIAEYGRDGCGDTTTLTASVTIEVVSDPAASPGASPATVSPEAVLDAYLAALLAGDCETARTFATETFTVGSGDLCGGATVEDVRIHPTGPARPSEDEVVIATTLTITGGDASMPDGEQTWFYVLGRQPDGSWRLTGGGSGP